MNKTAWTPGPWHLSPDSDNWAGVPYVKKGDTVVAGAMTTADAELITLTPEMAKVIIAYDEADYPTVADMMLRQLAKKLRAIKGDTK